MKKEEILKRNKIDNRFGDEMNRQVKTKAHFFSLVVALLVSFLISLIKSYHNQPTADINTIIWSIAFGSLGYDAYVSKDKSKAIIALFCFFFMSYYFYTFIRSIV